MKPLMHTVSTSRLDIAYWEWLPESSRTVVLLHGWPDSPQGWNTVAAVLAQAGWRVIAPALRGFAPTRYRSADIPRSGQLSALGRDVLEMIEALKLQHPVLVGHDWGARAAANACGLCEGIASHLIMISVGYATNSPDQVLSLPQAKNYWYHWFMATPVGERALRSDPAGFARMMWDTWSPQGWYREADFIEAAAAFAGDDWVETVLHSYRHRWNFVAGDSSYDADEARLHPAPVLSVPTLVLHGTADTCNGPATSEGREHLFTGRYQRRLLEGIGHFPQREAPQQVAREILDFIGQP
ncbi:pimeloyl-ACP methyl ester carboxylesterase [Neisseria sp. HSC-16F19]|nr:alpha/beta hydrolase [Neisseria sp. HSC-16F19]MCP2040531.1 pimeloyl-ACP methyl ester carboxylesterase [Neisseria sp. HSC-16F19]